MHEQKINKSGILKINSSLVLFSERDFLATGCGCLPYLALSGSLTRAAQIFDININITPFQTLITGMCREGNVCAQSYLYLQTEQQSSTTQPSRACTQGQLLECQRSIRKLWPNKTGSSAEVPVHPHTDKLARSSLGEPVPHHPFAEQPFFGICKADSVALVQFQSSREAIHTSLAVCPSGITAALSAAVACRRSRKRDQVDLWMT